MYCADVLALYAQLKDRGFFPLVLLIRRNLWLSCMVANLRKNLVFVILGRRRKNEYERTKTKMIVISSFRLRHKWSPLNDEKEENNILLVLLSRK